MDWNRSAREDRVAFINVPHEYRYIGVRRFALRLLAINPRLLLLCILRTLGKIGAGIHNLRVAGSGRRECIYTMNANETKQTFSFKAPDAHNVLLAGDFTHWLKQPIPLRKQPDGVWSVTASLKPGTYHYRFVVDGEWRDD